MIDTVAEKAGREWERKSRGDDSLSVDQMFEYWYSSMFVGDKEAQRQAFVSGFNAERIGVRQ